MIDLSKFASSYASFLGPSKLEKGSYISMKLPRPGDMLGPGLQLSETAKVDRPEIGSTMPINLEGTQFTGVVRAVDEGGVVTFELT